MYISHSSFRCESTKCGLLGFQACLTNLPEKFLQFLLLNIFSGKFYIPLNIWMVKCCPRMTCICCMKNNSNKWSFLGWNYLTLYIYQILERPNEMNAKSSFHCGTGLVNPKVKEILGLLPIFMYANPVFWGWILLMNANPVTGIVYLILCLVTWL